MSFSLVLAALSSATAPASTMMTIKQTKAKGDYVNTLLEVVALDDVVTLILYSVAISICMALTGGGKIGFTEVGWPIIQNLICLVIGFAFGFALRFLISSRRTTDNRLGYVLYLVNPHYWVAWRLVWFTQIPLKTKKSCSHKLIISSRQSCSSSLLEAE